MFNIIRKELLTFIKDRRAMMLSFIVPIALISVFSLAFGGAGNDSDVHKIPLLVVDEDHSALSKDVMASVDSVKMLKAIRTTNDSALNLIKTGKRSAALVIHKGFSDSANNSKPLPWELEYDAAQAQEMGMLQQYLGQSIYGKLGKTMMEKTMRKTLGFNFGFGGATSNSANESQFDSSFNMISKSIQGAMRNTMKLKMTSVVKQAQDSIGMIQAVAGTAVMMLLFGLTAMGGRILEEKENGTLKRLLYSPLHSNEILTGKMITAVIVAFAQLMVMLAFSWMVFGLHLWSKIFEVSILVIATGVACSGFGVFLASVVRSRDQLQGMSTLVVLVMSAIGGSMIPTFIMPNWMQNISPISINYWSIQGFYDIFWRQLPVYDINFLTKVGVLLAIGFILTMLSFRFFRKNVLSIA